MYKYAYFSISLLLSCCAKMDVMAQVTVTSDMLMGKKWVARFDVGECSHNVFIITYKCG